MHFYISQFLWVKDSEEAYPAGSGLGPWVCSQAGATVIWRLGWGWRINLLLWYELAQANVITKYHRLNGLIFWKKHIYFFVVLEVGNSWSRCQQMDFFWRLSSLLADGTSLLWLHMTFLWYMGTGRERGGDGERGREMWCVCSLILFLEGH